MVTFIFFGKNIKNKLNLNVLINKIYLVVISVISMSQIFWIIYLFDICPTPLYLILSFVDLVILLLSFFLHLVG